jgi:BMFP domain-containing protein YqiC
MNNSISNKSPSMFDQNTLFDMSGHVASLFGNEIKNGSNNFEQMHRANINQQMSDMGLHEHHEILSSGGMNNSHFH